MKVKCPKCGSKKTVPIVYGLPTMEGFEQAERKEIVLGGCSVIEGAMQPNYACLDCKCRWNRKAV